MIHYSIIITFYTGLNILKANLQLLVPTITKETEIIIVNDNPDYTLLETELCPGFNRLKVINMAQNGGYSRACNVGAQASQGEALIFMDCDIMPTAGWFMQMVASAKKADNCGALSATIINMNSGGVVHWGMGMLQGVDVLKPFRDGCLPKKFRKGLYEFSLLTSGCLYVPKSVFDATQGFDEILYNGYCDLDLIMQIRALGYQCYADSEAVVYHRGKVAGQTRMAAEEDTRALFIMKWHTLLPNDSLDILPRLYRSHECAPSAGDVYWINFCHSLFEKEYRQMFADTFDLVTRGIYEFKTVHATRILLEDHLSWSLIALPNAIVYFCDTFTTLLDNKHWFYYRQGKGDFIADRNGNLVSTDTINFYH